MSAVQGLEGLPHPALLQRGEPSTAEEGTLVAGTTMQLQQPQVVPADACGQAAEVVKEQALANVQAHTWGDCTTATSSPASIHGNTFVKKYPWAAWSASKTAMTCRQHAVRKISQAHARLKRVRAAILKL